MKKVLIGVIVGLTAGLLLPAQPREKLSRQLAAVIERMEERMPDG